MTECKPGVHRFPGVHKRAVQHLASRACGIGGKDLDGDRQGHARTARRPGKHSIFAWLKLLYSFIISLTTVRQLCTGCVLPCASCTATCRAQAAATCSHQPHGLPSPRPHSPRPHGPRSHATRRRPRSLVAVQPQAQWHARMACNGSTPQWGQKGDPPPSRPATPLRPPLLCSTRSTPKETAPNTTAVHPHTPSHNTMGCLPWLDRPARPAPTFAPCSR